MQCTVFLILYKLLQIEITQLQVLKDVLRLTDGKLPTARSAAVHVCNGWREAVSDLCELQGALVRAWRRAAKEAEVIREGTTSKMAFS